MLFFFVCLYVLFFVLLFWNKITLLCVSLTGDLRDGGKKTERSLKYLEILKREYAEQVSLLNIDVV